jgi:hypothetical protein
MVNARARVEEARPSEGVSETYLGNCPVGSLNIERAKRRTLEKHDRRSHGGGFWKIAAIWFFCVRMIGRFANPALAKLFNYLRGASPFVFEP